jgi:hypothetical protein
MHTLQGLNFIRFFCFVQKDSEKGTIEHQSTEEAELSAWAFAQLRGLLSPSDIEKLLLLLKVNNISSLLLLKSMPEADLFKVSCFGWIDMCGWQVCILLAIHPMQCSLFLDVILVCTNVLLLVHISANSRPKHV